MTGDGHVRLCVQRRLARSVGGSPTGVTARRPVPWMVGWRETKIDTAILEMASDSGGTPYNQFSWEVGGRRYGGGRVRSSEEGG